MNNLQQFIEKCPCPVVVVTGGDGRSTVAQLLYLMMSEAGKKVFLCEDGIVDFDDVDVDLLHDKNAAADLLSKLTNDLFLIVESDVSIALGATLSPFVAVVVGDVADTKDIEALSNMLSLQKKEGFSVVSIDRSYGEQLQAKSVAQKFPVSRTQAVTHGAHIEGPAIIFCAPGVCQMVGNMSKVLLKGAEDPENILAAVTAARVLQIPVPVIQKVLYSFEGDEAELKDSEV